MGERNREIEKKMAMNKRAQQKMAPKKIKTPKNGDKSNGKQ